MPSDTRFQILCGIQKDGCNFVLHPHTRWNLEKIHGEDRIFVKSVFLEGDPDKHVVFHGIVIRLLTGLECYSANDFDFIRRP